MSIGNIKNKNYVIFSNKKFRFIFVLRYGIMRVLQDISAKIVFYLKS
jgi:hypothetical protein